ncbi:short-chain alcohol dehydrogenase like protein [Saccharomonospora marina XMU15]|uniref:Short-chain alcohol dehydrogenase like protein n=1 Tax=Saccharomonospora marina XMU15 TaxID=882083 RepID=H5X9E4_9PSEU|nr:SDR family oxidoreductase [Saccharomonospora marina]EHR50309.1 short-chain alcohol dehydrogenase like protein [Saccharomonospora marina XMU15]
MAGLVSLAGKVALVTGAARGQGAAQARLFAELGAQVIVTDTRETEGADVASALGEQGSFDRLNVADAADWERVVARALDTHGRLDVLVNNAGIYHKAPLAETSQELLRELLDVNLLGPILGMRTVAPWMPDGSAIVNVASISGLRGHAGAIGYASAKWGLRGASRSAARELAPRVRVNCVCPGAVDTPMIDAATLDLSHLPLPRAGTVGEVAAVVAFLACDASAYCTGAEFVVDGGATA